MPKDKTADMSTKVLAGMIRANRQDFARVYNSVALEQEKDAFVPLHALVQVERLLDPGAKDDDVSAFRLAFRQAEQGDWVRALLQKVVTAGMLGDTSASKLAESIGAAALPEGEGISLELEANVLKGDGFVDPVTLAGEMQRATRRVCQVLVDGERLGTGFLIGPQVVLTNWHVVKDLYGAGVAGPLPSLTGVSVKVAFDRFKSARGGAVTYAVTSVDAVSAAYDSEKGGTAHVEANYASPEERLDFAALRLDGLPGVERGWYRIEPELWPRKNASLYVVQYPGQFELKISVGKFHDLQTAATRRRVRYQNVTAKGSSGGLCLGFDTASNRLKPSALHQGSLKTAGEEFNQGIPLAKIAPLIQHVAGQSNSVPSLLRLGAASGPDHRGAPVLGRATFQKHVADAVAGTARILIVRPLPRPGQSSSGLGKSFSEVLLQSLTAPDANLIVSFKAANIPSDAKGCAEAIMARIASGDGAVGWTDAANPGTTETAWISDVLISTEFAPRLKAAANGRLVWLVIDELDRTDLPDAGGRRFLDALYQRIEALPELRIVLIGLKHDLPSIPVGIMRVDELIDPPGEPEIVRWLVRRFGRERAVDQDLLTSFAKLAIATSESGDTASLARVIRDRLDANLPDQQDDAKGEEE